MSKNRMLKIAFLLLCIMLLLTTQNLSAVAGSRQKKVQPLRAPQSTGEILVKVKPGKDISSSMSILGGKLVPVSKRLGVQKIKLPEGMSASLAVAQYFGNPNVEYAEPDYIRSVSFTPNDPSLQSQWALDRVGAKQAWDMSTGKPSVIIAVIDSGIDYNHPDLKGKLVSPYNSMTKASGLDKVSDDFGHGTHVAGIAAASFNNNLGVAGIGGNVSVMPIKAGIGGQFSSSDVDDGIYWAVDHGARVINLSLGGYGSTVTDQNAINYAVSHNVIVVAAAGNDGINQPTYPAGYNGVIAVAATDQNDLDADFSNYGDFVDISAPGVNILSTTPTYSVNGVPLNYGYGDGTSMATPFVAGLAGLLFSANPSLSNPQVEQLIYSNAKDIDTPGWDPYTGWGRIDAYRTLLATVRPFAAAVDTPGQGESINGTRRISGWVLDGNGVVQLDVLLDGKVIGQAVYGDPRPDVAAVYPQYGNPNSGFHFDLDVSTLAYGQHTITIRETSASGSQNTVSGRSFQVLSPAAWIDTPLPGQGVGGKLKLSGWALDGSGVAKIEVLVDGVVKGVPYYGDWRPDVGAVFPAYQNVNSGFHLDSIDVSSLSHGSHSIAIQLTAKNGAKTVLAASNFVQLPPVAVIDVPSPGQGVSGHVGISGWVLDGSGVAKLSLLVDGIVKGDAVYGDQRNDVSAVFPAYGNSNSGFHLDDVDITSLSSGSHTFALQETALNGSVTVLGASTAYLLSGIGVIDFPGSGEIRGTTNVSGWFLDGSGVTRVDMLVDGMLKGQALYGDSRPDVDRVFPAFKNVNSGYHVNLDTTTLANGTHTLAVRATGTNTGQTTVTRLINISNRAANGFGVIDLPAPSQNIAGKSVVSGWFLDANGVSNIEILLDGKVLGNAAYGLDRPDVFTVYPAFNNAQSGFSYALDTTLIPNGPHSLVVRETSGDKVQATLGQALNVANLPAVGWIDFPTAGQSLSGTGTYTVSGWVLDGAGVQSVEVIVDGKVLGSANYAKDRPDVQQVFPLYNNPKAGYDFTLDLSGLSAGQHTLTVRETSKNTTITVLPARSITKQ